MAKIESEFSGKKIKIITFPFIHPSRHTLKTPVFEIASVLKYFRVEIFVLHNGKFCIEKFS
jgi:hypothetical protein